MPSVHLALFFSETGNVQTFLMHRLRNQLSLTQNCKSKNKKMQNPSRYKTYSCIQNDISKGLMPRKTNQIFPCSVQFSKTCLLSTRDMSKHRLYWFTLHSSPSESELKDFRFSPGISRIILVTLPGLLAYLFPPSAENVAMHLFLQ